MEREEKRDDNSNRDRKKGGEKRCSGVGVVTMIESFPARSEACQNAEGPPGPSGETGL